MSRGNCGHECSCPSHLHHAALEALARYDAPIPRPTVGEIISTLQYGQEKDEDEAESWKS